MILNQNNVLPYVKMEKFTISKHHLVNPQDIAKMEKFGMNNQNNVKLMFQKMIIKKEITQIMEIKEEIKMTHMILVMVMIMEVIVLKMIKNMKENVKEVRKFLENANVLKIKN